MRLLIVYTGALGPLVDTSGLGLDEELRRRPTSHPSEVNMLQVGWWLREDHGFDVDVLVNTPPGDRQWLLNPAHDPDPADYDRILVWKIHGVRRSVDLLKRCRPGQVVIWYDAGKLHDLIGQGLADRVGAVLWGTSRLRGAEAHRWPAAANAVVEHAINMIDRPATAAEHTRGLYIGRMPAVYRDAVFMAAPCSAFALWFEPPAYWGFRPGDRVLMRPDQLAEHRQRYEQCAGHCKAHGVMLRPAVNLCNELITDHGWAFGLVPATGYPTQFLSASKFWDYLAMGLPVLVADNVPEARHLATSPVWLGETYRHMDRKSMFAAIRRIAQRDGRAAIQDWAWNFHTYRHRAEEIARYVR